MAATTSGTASNGENTVSTTIEHHDPEKERHSPIFKSVEAPPFNIDGHDLPKGYFLTKNFIGTMLAAGLALAGVSTASCTLPAGLIFN